MAPRSLYFLPAALALLPACEAEPNAVPPSEVRAIEREPAAQPETAAVAAQAECGQPGGSCCENDACAEGAECSDGVCVHPFLEPCAIETADEQ